MFNSRGSNARARMEVEFMLRSMNSLMDYTIRATDGLIGMVHDFYFDDRLWNVRYLIVDTGSFLSGRKVLLAPAAFGKPDWIENTFPINHTREEIQDSPSIDTEKPVTREDEEALHDYYRWMPYWAPGLPNFPYIPIPESREPREPKNPDLCSFRDTRGYAVESLGGIVGKMHDLILDDQTWAVQTLVIDTGTWFTSKKVLLGSNAVQELDWHKKAIRVAIEKPVIDEAPEFDPGEPINEQVEVRYYDYYGRPQSRV